MNEKIRNKFSPKKSVPLIQKLPSRAQEHYQNDQNVNHIMAKYRKTGDASLLLKVKTEYGTFENFEGLSKHVSKLARAEEAFAALPQSIQKQFNWQPGEMLEFIDDPKNKEAAIKMGLFTAPKPPDEHLEILKSIQKNTQPVKKRQSQKSDPE